MTAMDQTVSPRLAWRKRYAGLAQWLAALPYLLPTIIGFFVFVLGPVVASFLLSFTQWDVLTPPQWIGLGNYAKMFFDMPLFWKTLSNTFYYTMLYVPAGVILPLLVAVVMNQQLRGITFYRSVYFLPVVTSTVAVALVWQWLYNPEFGPINFLLGLVGIKGPGWTTSPQWAMPAIVVMSVWQGLGYNMVIYLAGLQGINPELYEVAAIDGANLRQVFWHITLPLMRPIILFTLVLSTVGAMTIFDEPYLKQ